MLGCDGILRWFPGVWLYHLSDACVPVGNTVLLLNSFAGACSILAAVLFIVRILRVHILGYGTPLYNDILVCGEITIETTSIPEN